MIKFPKKGSNKYEVLEGWIAFEKESGLDRYEKDLFSAGGPKLVSSQDIPWGDEVRYLVVEGYKRFICLDDWLSEGAKRMHDEVISMMSDLLGNGIEAGNITTGGSESNFCAMFTAKSRALATGRIKAGHKPSIVLPKTAHYSFFKGSYLFDFEPIVVDPIPGTTYKVDPEEMRKAVREDTIAIVGTAGTFPFGTVDPIEEIGEIAQEKDLYFHVDACLGGFMLPFLEKGGYNIEIPKWDFRVRGVSSISADFHKNGMVPPPCSCIIYRDEELLGHANKIAPPRGTLTGTRAVGPIAAAWTMIKLIGLEGYIIIARRSRELVEMIMSEVRQMGLKTVTDGKINLAIVYSDEYDLMPVANELRRQGWVFTTTTSFPPIGFMFAVWRDDVKQVRAILEDLKKSMKFADRIKSKAEMKVYGPEYPMILEPPAQLKK